MLEIEYLKSDIERLLVLLRSTKEVIIKKYFIKKKFLFFWIFFKKYKEFSNFSKDSENLRYLNKMPNLIIEN
jgi:hypothetical protein